MTVSPLYNLHSVQSFISFPNSHPTHSINNLSFTTEQNHTLDLNMSNTFYVTPISELEKLEDWNKPLAFQAAHHHETLNSSDSVEVEWRLRDRV